MIPTPPEKLGHLGFAWYEPSEALKPYVEGYWCIDTTLNQPKKERQHPNGGLSLVFNFGDDIWTNGEGKGQTCYFEGVTTNSNHLIMSGRVNALGIRFKAGRARQVFRLPLRHIKNVRGDACELFDHGYATLYQRLAECPDHPQRVAIVEGFFTPLLNGVSPLKHVEVIDYCLDWFRCRDGKAHVHQLLKSADLGERQLERLFADQVGLSPKQYAGLIRVERARDLLENEAVADVSYMLAYSDQAHFSHHFKRVVGYTPGQYQQIKRAG